MSSLVIEIYGEFDYIVRAFQLIAHLFSNNSDYLALLWIFGTVAIFFTGAFAIGSSTLGKGNIQTWFMYVVGTSALIMILTIPKSTITIADMTTNQMITVGGIPTVMATVASIENKIESTVTRVIENVMQPILPYDVIGKGTGFELLATIDKVGKEFFNLQPYTGRSIQDYWQKCVIADLSLGFMSEDSIYKTDDIWQSIKSTTRSRYSDVYNHASNGTPVTHACADSWTAINNQLTDAVMVRESEKLCSDKYNNNPNAKLKCMNSLQDIVGTVIAPTTNLNSYLRSYLVSWAMMSSAGVLEKSLADVNQKYMSSAMMAEKQIPRLKGVLYGMIIGIFPILVLFIWFNPVKTLTFYLGMFILLILWSAIDTFMDMQYQNEVVNLFATMRRQGLGVHQMFDISSISADAVALYGSSRWLALGLATAISTAITGISSYAISQMGSQLASTAQGAATANAGFMSSSGQFQQRSQAMQDQTNRELLDGFTVANYQGIADSSAQSQWNNSLTGAALSKQLGGNQTAGIGLSTMGVTNTLTGMGSAGAKVMQANALGLSEEQWGAFNQNNRVLNDDIAKTLNSKFGVDSFKSGQQLTAGFQEDGSLKNMSVDYMDGKTKVTQMLDNNGRLAVTNKHGGNYDNYSLDHKSGYEKGIYTFTEDGAQHNQVFNGASMTEIYNKDGVRTEEQFMKKDGEWQFISATKEGLGYAGYGIDADGNEKGSKTFTDENGVKHTQTFSGSRMIDTYSQNGQEVTVTRVKTNDGWIDASIQSGNNFQLSNEAMQSLVQKGDASLIKNVMYDNDGNLTAEGRVIVSDSARVLEQLYSSSKSTNLNLGGSTFFGGVNTSSTQQGSEMYNELVAKAEELNNMQHLTSEQKAEIFAGTVSNTFDTGREYIDKNMALNTLDKASIISDKFQEYLNKII